MINGFFQQTYFQNRVIDYIIAVAIFILLVISIRIIKSILLKLLKAWAKKTTTTIDDKFVNHYSLNSNSWKKIIGLNFHRNNQNPP